MRVTFFFFFLLLLHLQLAAQQTAADTTIYNNPERKALFPGGSERLQEYIDMRLKSDQASYYNIHEGEITIGFVVEKNGRVNHVQVLKSLDSVFDQNFVSLFWGMPKWIPAQVNGKPARSYVTYTLNMNYYMN